MKTSSFAGAFALLVAFAPSLIADASCRSIVWSQHHEQATAVLAGSIVVVDHDGDTIPDLLTHHSPLTPTDGSLYSRRGAGDGSFGAPVLLAEHVSEHLATGDLDRDGISDLVVIFGASLGFLRGTGAGFDAPQTHLSQQFFQRVAIGNFDGDPDLELLGVKRGGFVVYDYVDGALVAGQSLGAPLSPTSMAVADLDNDSRQDLLIGNFSNATLLIYYRNADGTFRSPVSLLNTGSTDHLATGDIDGDGDLDLVATYRQAGLIGVFLNAGPATFALNAVMDMNAPGAADLPSNAHRLAESLLHDIDGDGDLDLVVGNQNRGGVVTAAGNGDGTFLLPTWVPPTNGNAYSIAIADFDKDDVLDLAAGAWPTLIMLEASCTPVQVHGRAKPREITVGDTTSIEISVSGMNPGTAEGDRGTVSIGGETATLDANARAALPVSGLPLGTHEVPINYSGNGTLPPATGTATVIVGSDVSTVEIDAPAEPPVYGSPWSIDVTVRTPEGFETGPYYVSLDGGAETRYDWNHGLITFDLLTPGPHTIRARFAGNDYDPPGQAEIAVTALKATPRIGTQPVNGTTVRVGTAHTTDVIVSKPVGAPSSMLSPTGVVTVFEGTTLLHTEPLVNTFAHITLPVLPRGTHELRVSYSGDANFQSAELTFTLQVLPNEPLAIEARALPAGIHIAYVAPAGSTSLALFRRAAGNTTWQPVAGWNSATGMDPDVLSRGVVYEYQLQASSTMSNVDSAMLFLDDVLTAGTTVKLTHFIELRRAINEQRMLAGLPPFEFASGFGASAIVRASHINGARTAINQARSILGMTTATFTPISVGTTIRASDVQQLRDLVR